MGDLGGSQILSFSHMQALCNYFYSAMLYLFTLFENLDVDNLQSYFEIKKFRNFRQWNY